MKTIQYKRKRLIPRPLLVVLCMFLIVQVVVANRLATSGITIAQMETEIATLTDENHELKEKVASESALTSLRTKAKNQGFTQASQPVFLTKDLPVALELH